MPTIDEWKAIREKATKGPVKQIKIYGAPLVVTSDVGWQIPHTYSDFDFIVHCYNNLSSLIEECERLQKNAKELIAYAVSCRLFNTKDWMDGLQDKINALAEAVGDKDRCRFDRSDGFIIDRDLTPNTGSAGE